MESYLFINNKKATEDYKQGFSYGLKSARSPLQVKDLIQFKDDLVRVAKELKFHKVKNSFQKNIALRYDTNADIKENTNSCR